MATIEFTFNSALGDALQRASVRWQSSSVSFHVEETQVLAGQGKKGLQPDILICDPLSPPLVIESSFSGPDADKDAQARLGERAVCASEPIHTAVSLAIDERFRSLKREHILSELLAGSEIRYALYQRIPEERNRRWPTTGFIDGSVFDLSDLLPAASLPKEVVERVADDVAERIVNAADILEAALTDSQQEEVAERVQQRTPLKGLRTTMVLWLNAMLTQQRLSQQAALDIPGIDVASDAPIQPSHLTSIWRRILSDNWNSIFEPAVGVLEQIAQYNQLAASNALEAITKAVETIEVNRLGLQINVGAELFPKLSDDRKQAAKFYTQPSTAELLAGLTIKREELTDLQWRSPDLFRHRKVADLACGTGTLLRAGFRRLSRLHEEVGGTPHDAANLHRGAMESGLIGTDISPIAAHLTTSSLAALGQGEPYGDTQVGWVGVGEPDRTGSLMYLQANEVADLFDTVAGRSTGDGAEAKAVAVEDGKIDWILMNPPYSRTRGKQSAFDINGLTDEERKQCQKLWAKQTNSEYTNRKAGMGASFLELAHKKVKLGGRIGFVLPLTAAFADSWSNTRRLIERDFSDITTISVAAGKALNKTALSADTGMEEMLLIATLQTRSDENPNKPEDSEPPTIRCVTLFEPPTRMGEAGEIARAISMTAVKVGPPGTTLPIHVGEDEVGQITVMAGDGDGGPWSAVGLTNDDIAPIASDLSKGLLRSTTTRQFDIPVEMTTVDNLFEVGPTHDLIGHPKGGDGRGAFQFAKVTSPTDAIGSDRALWSAASKVQVQMEVKPTHKGSAPEGVGSDEKREEMRQRRSTLFYARNMRLTSQRLLVANTENAVMGGRAWTALQHDDPRVLAAFALWANSTLGLVVHWTQGQRTQTGRSTTQVGAVKKIPCPRLDELDGAVLDRAGELFIGLKDLPLLPANQAHGDQHRKEIDAAVVEIMGWPNEALKAIVEVRNLWCAEPSVHGQNKNALKLLRTAKLID